MAVEAKMLCLMYWTVGSDPATCLRIVAIVALQSLNHLDLNEERKKVLDMWSYHLSWEVHALASHRVIMPKQGYSQGS